MASSSSAAADAASDEQVFQSAIKMFGDGQSTIPVSEIVELSQTYCIVYSPSEGGDNLTQFTAGAALFVKAGVSPADTAVTTQLAVEMYCPQEKPYFLQIKSSLAGTGG